MKGTEISDSLLRWASASAALLIVAWFTAMGATSVTWREPGSPELYLTGVAGLLLLLVPAAFTVAKRGACSARPVAWFNAHVLCSLAGMVLIAIHTGGYLRRPPALLLLVLGALALLGVWARTEGTRRMAATFASKAPSFRAPDSRTRQRLRELIVQKRALLPRIDANAQEGTFSVNLPHFIRCPRLAFAYRKLEQEESTLLGSRGAVSRAQAWWRPLHLALAWIFVIGALIHVITVTFFAGYVADGGPITWWHLRDWGG